MSNFLLSTSSKKEFSTNSVGRKRKKECSFWYGIHYVNDLYLYVLLADLYMECHQLFTLLYCNVTLFYVTLRSHILNLSSMRDVASGLACLCHYQVLTILTSLDFYLGPKLHPKGDTTDVKTV